MNILTKKGIIGLTTGVIILAGTLSPFAVQAAADQGNDGQPPAMHQRHFDPDKFAQRIADTYGVSKQDVLKYLHEKVNVRDVVKASFFAKASGKPLSEVMAAKTYDNTWKDVAASLGVTKEQIKATRNDIASTRLEAKLHIPKQTSLNLMQQGYHARDIAVANALSHDTGKPIMDILAMKQINNSWHDVATTLGVNDNTFKKDMKEIKAAFHHKGFHGNHQSFMM